MLAEAEPQVMVVSLSILVGMLGPLYALVGGLYILLFRHSTNDHIHFDSKSRPVSVDLCGQFQDSVGEKLQANQREHDSIHKYINDVDSRSVKAVENLKTDMICNFAKSEVSIKGLKEDMGDNFNLLFELIKETKSE